MSKQQVMCKRCVGLGFITHPDWKAFWESDENQKAPLDEIKVWMEKNDLLENGELPDNEITCPVCKGAGTVEEKLEIISNDIPKRIKITEHLSVWKSEYEWQWTETADNDLGERTGNEWHADIVNAILDKFFETISKAKKE